MWGQLSTTCSNVLKQPNWKLLVAVNHNQLQTMASETVDPIDWSHHPPLWAVPPERIVHSINQCNRSIRGNHLAYAATQGIKPFQGARAPFTNLHCAPSTSAPFTNLQCYASTWVAPISYVALLQLHRSSVLLHLLATILCHVIMLLINSTLSTILLRMWIRFVDYLTASLKSKFLQL